MKQKICLLLIVLLFGSVNSIAQNKKVQMDTNQKLWEDVDSLEDIGKFKSASVIVKKILDKAKRDKNQTQEIKATSKLIYFGANADLNEEDNVNDDEEQINKVVAIKKLESEIANAKSIELKSIFQSRTAKAYWEFYLDESYNIYERTQLAVQKNEDINTWTVNDFHNKISDLYLQSIANRKQLVNTPLIQFKEILASYDSDTINFIEIKTLYDLLVLDAINYFKRNERYNTQPAVSFNLDKAEYLLPLNDFLNISIQNKENNNNQYFALKLYQELLLNYKETGNIDGLIAADMLRLEFVNQNSNLQTKTDLYQKALLNYKTIFPKNPKTAEAWFEAVNLKQAELVDVNDYSKVEHNISKDISSIIKEYQEIIAAYPNTNGAIEAQNSITQLEKATLSIDVEDAYLPNENIKIALGYKNIQVVNFSVYKTDIYNIYNPKPNGNPILKWNQKLVNAADYNKHSVELKVDPLPIGLYKIVITDPKTNLQIIQLLQISELAAVFNNNAQRYSLNVVNRKDGNYINNAQFIQMKFNYDSKKEYNTGKILNTINADKNGKITFSNKDKLQANQFVLSNGKDTFVINPRDNYAVNSNYLNEKNTIKEPNRTFIFTDRSIYRPGQIIYFKAISLQGNGGKKYDIIANNSIKLTFKNANYETVKELTLKSNEFGSVAGSFVAPESGLMGQMTIATDGGNVYFNVEEYKRPKFFVQFDSLKSNYSLNENVKITGKALAYSGNNVDAANVTYSVKRTTNLPYPWLRKQFIYYSDFEVNNGTTTTDENGNFIIEFKAIPDNKFTEKELPIFNYAISVDVTDINGETRSSVQNIAIGYHTLNLKLNTAPTVLAQNFDKVNITSNNLNGNFQAIDLSLKIHQLKPADKLYRKRMWKTPTDFIYTKPEFEKLFPYDEYNDEWDLEKRTAIATVYSNNFKTNSTGVYDLPKNIFKSTGYYLIEISTKDKSGKTITDKQNVFVFNPNAGKQFEFPLLVLTDKTAYEPNEVMKLYIAPAVSNINLIQVNSWNKHYNWKNDNLIQQKITEADRGTKNLSWAYVYNNKFYSTNNQILIPWSNKDLNLSWATHRNTLNPGEKEEWKVTIKGNKKEQVAAEMLAGLYDASLDAILPHNWNWSKLYGGNYDYNYFNGIGFTSNSNTKNSEINLLPTQEIAQPYFDIYPFESLQFASRSVNYGIEIDKKNYVGALAGGSAPRHMKLPDPLNNESASDMAFSDSLIKNREDGASNNLSTNTVKIRSNFQETAFFIPQLQTDQEGNIQLKFTIPEALTTWKFMAFAHTKDWQTGYLTGSIQTQKELMVSPNLPRFFRQGDKITVAAKISNLTDKQLTGKARIEILNASTLQSLNLPFGFKSNEQTFTVASKQSSVVNFDLNIPEALYEPVIVKIFAEAGNFTDGEEHIIPVVSNRMLVTESLAMPVNTGSATFTFNKLLESNNSNTLLHKGLTVEYTSNPAWYAVQSLPYLIDFPYECTEQTFNKYFANALAGHIVSQSPKIASIFEKWRTTDTNALLSNLEKNQELKSALLEETPWVLDAKNEQQQKKNIARLFETHQLSKGLSQSIEKLKKMQNSDGSFSWFSGMQGNRFITQYILTGIAKLNNLNVKNSKDADVASILKSGMQYLDQEILKEYKAIKKENLNKDNLTASQIQYLYLRSMLPITVDNSILEAFNYYSNQSILYWNKQNNYLQGMIALSLYRNDEKIVSKTIIESLEERAFVSKEMGMYWKANNNYNWYELPIESQSLLITAFDEIKKDTKTVDQLKLWLLKQKQTQNWSTTTATADACYALLKTGTDWLQSTPEVTIQLGNYTINSKDEVQEAGTGYFKKQIDGNSINKEMGNIKVTVDNINKSVTTWGAVYWQYFEQLNKVTANKNNVLKISKKLYQTINSKNGPILNEITSTNPLKIGDKVTVRIELKVDRDLEYVHMKDMRAAGFEPINVLSAYQYKNGLGYYESTKDIASHFFFDYLPKGTHVFEYTLVVAQKGDFSNGNASIQCMYAPEFNAHSEGVKVIVK